MEEESRSFIEDLICNDKYLDVYQKIRANEIKTKESLVDFEKEYPDAVERMI